MIKVNRNLILFSGLFLTLATVLLFVFQKISPIIGHVTYYCQTFINTHMIPVPYYLSLIPFGLLFLVVTLSIIRVGFLSLRTQILVHNLKNKTIIPNDIYRLLKRIGIEEKTVIIQSKKRFAFCLGMRKPKIYVSTGLVSELSPKEVEAVLLHEQYHLENHDTITQMIASIVNSLFPFLPLVGDLLKNYRVEREIRADSFAVKKIGDSYPLVCALKKLLAFPTIQDLAFAAIADKDTLEPRIYSLVNKPYTRKKFRIKHFLISLFSSVIIGVIVVMPVHAKEIHHEEHDAIMLCTNNGECMKSCTSENNLNNLYSKMSINKTSTQLFTPAR